MEITKTNFKEKFEEISKAVDEATFLAFDTEFTGLDNLQHGHISPFDSTSERYTKLRKDSLDFLVIQFGLCAFKADTENQSYEARPFTFYIFPRPYSRQAPDRRFLCQSSSIDFLAQQGFDFNKLFREGISYLTQAQEQSMREALNAKHQQFARFSSPAIFSPDSADAGPGKGPIQIPDEQKDFIEGVCKKIGSFLETAQDEEALKLDPCNGFQRKLIYQTVRSKFSSVHLETKTGYKKERFIVVTQVGSDEELKKKEKEKQNAEIMEVEEAIGFSKVFKLITESGKLVVGHNMLLDVMLTLNQFGCPLPEELEEFKDMVKCCFPKLLDTKLMASTHPFREIIPSSVLEEMRKTLEKEPFTLAKVVLAEGFKHYEDAEVYHEAGYDAYITGIMCATMCNYLGGIQNSAHPFAVPTSPSMQPFINKLNLMRMADVPYLNIGGSDLQPARDHVFHLTFPKEWKASDINHLFSPYGTVQINWLNDTSAFVSLHKRDSANVVLKTLCQDKTVFQLIPYQVFKGGQTADVSSRKRVSLDADTKFPSTKKLKSNSNEEAKPLDLVTVPPIPEEAEMPLEKSESTNNTESIVSSSSHPGASDEKLFTEPVNW